MKAREVPANEKRYLPEVVRTMQGWMVVVITHMNTWKADHWLDGGGDYIHEYMES